MSKCGTCTLCCKLTGIKEIGKAVGEWCKYCNINVGCNIYDTRPQSCKNFECVWLRDGWGEELRPDKCHLMFEQIPGSDAYIAIREPGFDEAWLEELPQRKMRQLADGGHPVVIRTSPKTIQVLTPEKMSASQVWAELKTAFRKLL